MNRTPFPILLKRFNVVLAICLILASLSTGCTTASPRLRELSYGLTLAPSGIDPHIHASSELTIPLRSVYDSLVYRDPQTMEFIPGLAQEWSISADAKTYTFYLRDDVDFHDGTHFDAFAVKTNLERILNPDNHSQMARALIGPISQIEVVDKYQLSIQLEEPFGALLDGLSQTYLGMASPAALAEWGDEYQFHQIGTGPYRFREYVPNDHLTLELNEAYLWAPECIEIADLPFERITFKFYTDPATRALALESGAVDILGEIPAHEATRLDALEQFQLYAISIPGQPLQYMFNTQLPPTDDVLLREALLLSVDRGQIVSTIFGAHSLPAEDILTKNMPDFPYTQRFPAFDPEAAAALLDQAGWPMDPQTELRSNAGENLTIRIISPPWGMNPEVSQLIRAAWERLGITVEIEIVPGWGQLKEAQTRADYNAIGIHFFGTDSRLLSSFYSSTGAYSWSLYTHQDIDDWIHSADQLLPGTDNKNVLLTLIADEIRNQALILPIRDYTNLIIAQESIEGLRFNVEGWSPILIELSTAH